MSRVIELINAVHAQCDATWLFSSQREAYEALVGGFRSQRVLNVHGLPGVGKTVLAWVLEKEGYGDYHPDSTTLQQGSRRVLIDRFPLERRAARRLMDDLQALRIGQAVLLTDRRLDEDVPAFEIILGEDDILQVKANLFQHFGVKFYVDRQFSNLHTVVASAAQ